MTGGRPLAPTAPRLLAENHCEIRSGHFVEVLGSHLKGNPFVFAVVLDLLQQVAGVAAPQASPGRPVVAIEGRK